MFLYVFVQLKEYDVEPCVPSALPLDIGVLSYLLSVGKNPLTEIKDG